VAKMPLEAAVAPADRISVCGTVDAIEYQGSYVKVTIHRAGHDAFIAHLPDRDFFAQPVQQGDRVRARWSIDEVHLLGQEPGPSA